MQHLQALAMQDNPPQEVPRPAASPGGAVNEPTAAEDTRVLRSEELFAGARVVMIQHADELYRLMITRNNRLILQK
jgi:hemin uptake protein HemP